MERIPIIAFTGRKGSGKDTAADIIKSLSPETDFIHINFADRLKQMCRLIFDLSEEQTNDPRLKEEITTDWPYQTPRYLMQHAASQLRMLWPDIWIRSWESKVLEACTTSKPKVIIVTDLRFENEYDFLVGRKGFDVTIVKIKRSSILKGDESEKHVSEIFVDHMPSNVEMTNDDSKEEFASKVKAFYTIWENANVSR